MFLLASALPAAGFFPGGGKDAPKGNDCLVVLDGVEPGAVTVSGRKQVAACGDCDPACDRDGLLSADGACTFVVSVCSNQPAVEGCTPPAALARLKATAKVAGRKGAIDLTAGASLLDGAVCGPPVEVVVPLRKNGTKDGKATVSLSALVRKDKIAGTPKRKDRDRLRLACVPRPAGESCPPAPTTSTTVVGTTTTTAPLSTTTTTTGGTTTSVTVTSTTTPGSSTSTTLPTVPPPDPATVAPPVDPTVTSDIAATTAFLYGGPTPIQSNVAPDAIDPTRVAVLRGAVRDRDGAPIVGVLVSVLGHPELGQTLTRADGRWDLAANGGTPLTVSFTHDGFLAAQRQVDVPWRDWVIVPDVVLVPVDPVATPIDLEAAMPIQTARGSMQTDGDGDRQATVMVPQGTAAELVMPDGSTTPLTQLTVRATEFTVGAPGPAAMPGMLPPTSGYTYAVELSVDEAMAAGATSVEFDRPLPFYVENFLGFPVGTPVPLGYYDRARAQWVAAENGRVIAVVGETGGLADLDVDGDGLADTGAALDDLGVTDAERAELAGLYAPGQTLWRAPITHFTPWDCNWPYGPPADAEGPDVPAPTSSTESTDQDQCLAGGSIIDCERQVLGEAVAVTGTPFTLRYRSDRVPGTVRALDVTLSGASVPASLARIGVRIEVAGQVHEETFAPLPGQVTRFEWDGKDAYARTVVGAFPTTVRIDYVYPGVYQEPGSFQQSFANAGTGVAITADRTRQEITLSRTFEATLRNADLRGLGLGGWTLDAHHAYDPTLRLFVTGDGTRRRADSLGRVIDRVDLGGFEWADRGFAVGPDASVYFSTRAGAQQPVIRRVTADGTVTIVAGNTGPLAPRPYGDGGSALDASLLIPLAMTFGPDGSLYFTDVNVIRRVGPDGIIDTVAGVRNDGGDGTEDCSGSPGPDGVPATESRMCPQTDLVVAPDGSIYFPEAVGNRVRRVGPDGIVTTVAGTGEFCFSFGSVCGDGGPAVAADLSGVNSIALHPDGSLLVQSGNSIRRVGVDGIVTTVAGKSGLNGFSGDGGPAVDAHLNNPFGLVVTADGTIFVNDRVNDRLRMIDPGGIIRTIAGTGEQCFSGQDCNSGDGGPALQARLREPSSLELGPDGGLYLITNPVINQERRIRRIGAALPGFSDSDIAIPSTAGGQVHQFDATGRHLRTLHALTRATLLEFEYDAAGRLAAVVQATGGTDNVTTIERDGTGKPTAIVGPFGDETTLAVDAEGFLSEITNPAGESRRFTYGAGGLLATHTDPRDNVQTYTFGTGDDRLARDADAAGGRQDFARTDTASGFEVTRTTKLGLTTTYAVETPAAGTTERTTIAPDGATTTGTAVADAATATVTQADGTVSRQVSGPDPRFDMQAPIASELRVTLPSAAEILTTATRDVTLADPDDPLSLVAQTDMITVAGATTTVAWTTATGTFTLTSPEGRTREIMLDALGRVTGVAGPGIAPSVVTYDDRGRVAAVTAGTGPGARTIAFGYDPSGRVESITDPLGRTIGRAYDAAGRRTATTRPDGLGVAFAWDAASNLVGLTPPGRPAHGFGYDARDALVSVTPPAVPGGGPTTYATDDDGRLVTVTRPDGDVVTLGYDAGGRLASRVVSQGGMPVATQTTTYDAAGRVATVTAPSGIAVAYAYDGPLLLSETWTGDVAGTVARTWNASARPASEAVNGEAVALAYDGDGFLTAAGDLAITRHPDTGLPTATALGMVTDTTSYDLFGGSLTHAAAAGATPLHAASYTRDALGRQTERRETVEADPERVFAYEYDLLGRLTEVRRNGVVIEAYAYDANGNRTSATVGGVTRTGTYDDQDRLVTYGTASYGFDANGRLASKTTPGGTITYAYDPLGGLAEVALPGGDTVSYLTDGQGRRVAKRVNGMAVQGFLYAGPLRPVAELDGAGAVVRRFVYAGGHVPVYMVAGGDTFRLLSDEVGSVRLVVNAATGAVAQRLDYDAFGNVTLDTNPGFQPFGFAGGLHDPDTGLVRFGARDYDPETGRFTTRDPVGFAGGSTNLYTYAGNDPVNGNDPLGLFDWGSFAAGALVGVAEGLVGLADLVTGGAVSATGRNIWSGVDAVLDFMGYNYDSALDLGIDALDLEATVNKDSLEFFAGELCGLIGSGVATGGAGAAAGAGRGVLQGAGAGAERALASAATQAVARGSRAPALQVVGVREAEFAIARHIDDAAAAAERAAGQQAGRAAEEGGLWLVKAEQRSGQVAKSKPQSGLTNNADDAF